MPEQPLTLHLNPAEFRMVSALRDMPEGALKIRIMHLVDQLVGFARNPRCPEMQGDGVPCEQPHTDCDQCKVVLDMLEKLEGRFPK